MVKHAGLLSYDYLKLISQVERRRGKDSIHHGVEVSLVQRRVDSLPTDPPLVPACDGKPLPKQKG